MENRGESGGFFVETDVPEEPDVPEMPEGQRDRREQGKRAKNGSLMERRGSPTAKPWGTVAMRDKEERNGGEGWRKGWG